MNRDRTVIADLLPASTRVSDYEARVEAADRLRTIDQPKAGRGLTLLKGAWRGWLRFAEILGTFQMMVVLSLIYWIVLPIIAIPFKLLADPLVQRRPSNSTWVERENVSPTVETMRKQY